MNPNYYVALKEWFKLQEKQQNYSLRAEEVIKISKLDNRSW